MTVHELWGTVPWQPWSKRRPKVSRGGRRTHQDPEDKAAEERTSEHLSAAAEGWQLATTNVSIRLFFYRQTAQRVDLDNLIKHFLDSANGVLFVDDCQATRIVAELHLDRTNPRTEWRITNHVTATMVRHLTVVK